MTKIYSNNLKHLIHLSLQGKYPYKHSCQERYPDGCRYQKDITYENRVSAY